MIAGLDTSVLVRLLTGEPEDLALSAVRYIEERRKAKDRLFLSDWVLAETYHALQYHYQVPKADVLDALRKFLADEIVEGTGDAPAVLEISGLATANPGFIDRVIHRNYLGAGADELVTFEKAAEKLPKVRVLTGSPATETRDADGEVPGDSEAREEGP